MNKSRLTTILSIFIVIVAISFSIALIHPPFVYVIFGVFSFVILFLMPAFFLPLLLSKKNGQPLALKIFELKRKYYAPIYHRRTDNMVSILTITVNANETNSDRDYTAYDPSLRKNQKIISKSLTEQRDIDVLESYIWQVDQFKWKKFGSPTNKTAKLFFLIGTDKDVDVDQLIKDVSIASIDGLDITFFNTTLEGVTEYMYEFIGEKEENIDVKEVDPGTLVSNISEHTGSDDSFDMVKSSDTIDDEVLQNEID